MCSFDKPGKPQPRTICTLHRLLFCRVKSFTHRQQPTCLKTPTCLESGVSWVVGIL
ncbi:hypothetical protein HanRHA438_Chr08g0335211 [Helianthus annuus]|uniref:Uncharacterized protein n=1 Tax=Helianthus annuus TaxID=4232 RepID=A0A9K3IBV2_HELAN|nr:hypothetical protein HanXRQr2_Chr08g0324031 [Helianthus annuus]KAJ0896488.1 hypothetical protein HanRHA438_Chr08g0335211 [Helianthus annuus]